MDLSTGHAAYSLHAQDARRAVQEREYARIAQERAVDSPAVPARSRTSPLAVLLRWRARPAQ